LTPRNFIPLTTLPLSTSRHGMILFDNGIMLLLSPF
jgi:hypothetical protein